MDKSIILDLVFDGRCYGDKIKMFDNKKYVNYSDEAQQKIEKLCEGMPEEEKQKFLYDLSIAQCGVEAETADEYFKEGFKLGLILGAQNFLE